MPARPITAAAHRETQRRRPRPQSRGAGNASAGPSTHMKTRQVRSEETQTLVSLNSGGCCFINETADSWPIPITDNRFAVLQPTEPAPDTQQVHISPPRSEFTFTFDHRESNPSLNSNRRRQRKPVSVPKKIVLAPPIVAFPCSKQSSTRTATPLPCPEIPYQHSVTQSDEPTTQKAANSLPGGAPTAKTAPISLPKINTAPSPTPTPSNPEQQPKPPQTICSSQSAHVKSVLSPQPPAFSPIFSPSSLGDLTISSFPPSPSPRLSPPAPTTADRESRFFPSTNASTSRITQASVAAGVLAAHHTPSFTPSTSSKNDDSPSASPQEQQVRRGFGRTFSPERDSPAASVSRVNSLDDDSGYVSWVSDNVSVRNSSESETGEGESEWIGRERGFWRGMLDEGGRGGIRGRGWWGGGKGCEGSGRWSGER